MSSKNTTRRSLSELREERTDWSKVDAKTDAEIAADIAADPDAAAPLDAAWFAAAERVMPVSKDLVTLRIDRDVLEWFRAGGRGYQTRINAVLRSFYDLSRRR